MAGQHAKEMHKGIYNWFMQVRQKWEILRVGSVFQKCILPDIINIFFRVKMVSIGLDQQNLLA